MNLSEEAKFEDELLFSWGQLANGPLSILFFSKFHYHFICMSLCLLHTYSHLVVGLLAFVAFNDRLIDFQSRSMLVFISAKLRQNKAHRPSMMHILLSIRKPFLSFCPSIGHHSLRGWKELHFSVNVGDVVTRPLVKHNLLS